MYSFRTYKNKGHMFVSLPSKTRPTKNRINLNYFHWVLEIAFKRYVIFSRCMTFAVIWISRFIRFSSFFLVEMLFSLLSLYVLKTCCNIFMSRYSTDCWIKCWISVHVYERENTLSFKYNLNLEFDYFFSSYTQQTVYVFCMQLYEWR